MLNAGYRLQDTVDDPQLQLTRITTDLHSPVPTAELTGKVDTIRRSKRLWLLSATLSHEGVEVARMSALCLRTSPDHPQSADTTKPLGPEGLPTTQLFAGATPGQIPPGFHTTVETRWVPRESSGWR